MAVAAATRLAPTFYGKAFEERCTKLLGSKLSMTLTNVGGRGDGGVDIQGWWWLPRLSPESSSERRRIRTIIQCKAFDKKLGPVHVRELEGAALLEYHTSSAVLQPDTATSKAASEIDVSSDTPTTETNSELVAILMSLSGFSRMAIRRTMASPIPFLLLHLPPASNDEPDTLASIIWNAKLGSTNGILGGNMEI
ncbi:hypothetical protein FRC09_017430, partial [Ceratobasidium sp. 395]